MAKNIKIVTLTNHKTIIRLEEAKKVLSSEEFDFLNKLVNKLIEFDVSNK